MGLQNNHFCSTLHGEAPFNAKRHSTQAPRHAGSERGYPQSRQALDLLIQSQADRTATEDDPVRWLEIYLGEIRKGLTPESAVASLATSFETSEEDTLVNLMVDAHSLLHDAGCEESDTITTLLGLFNALKGQAGTKPSFTEWDDEESDDDPPSKSRITGRINLWPVSATPSPRRFPLFGVSMPKAAPRLLVLIFPVLKPGRGHQLLRPSSPQAMPLQIGKPPELSQRLPRRSETSAG